MPRNLPQKNLKLGQLSMTNGIIQYLTLSVHIKQCEKNYYNAKTLDLKILHSISKKLIIEKNAKEIRNH